MTEPRQEGLLEALRQRRDVTLNLTFEQFRPQLRELIASRLDQRLLGRVDPSDVLQETLIEASQRLDEYLDKPDRPFNQWLELLAKQVVASTHRWHLKSKRRTVDREVQEDDDPAGLDEMTGRRTPPAVSVLRDELSSLLGTHIQSLSPGDREILSLRHFDQMSNAQAAKALGITPVAASQRYFRAVERLRKKIIPDSDLAPDD